MAKSRPTPVAVAVPVTSTNAPKRIVTQEVYVAKAVLVQTNSETGAEDAVLAEAPVMATSVGNRSFRFWLLLALVLIAGVLALWYLRRKHRPVDSEPNAAAGT